MGREEGEGEGRGKAFYPGEYSGYEMGPIRLYISQEKMLHEGNPQFVFLRILDPFY
jgi:hypothetical protein